MSDRSDGPAAGTRWNKKQRNSNSEVDSADKLNYHVSLQTPMHTDDIQKKLARTTKQPSLHSFVGPDNTYTAEIYSDTEVVNRKHAKKNRSKSGKVYSTSIQFPTMTTNLSRSAELTLPSMNATVSNVSTVTTTACRGISTTCVNTCRTIMTLAGAK